MFSRVLGGLHLLVWSCDGFGQLTRVHVCERWNMLRVKKILFTDFSSNVPLELGEDLFSFANEMGWL